MTLNDWLNGLAESSTPTIDECVAMLGNNIDWLCRYKETPQDPEWHAEGNVHIHTGMVLQSLYDLLAHKASHITGWKRQALILSAILHDIAKPVRTKSMEINGIERVVSPKHEAIGRSYLTFKLMALDLPFQVIWTTLNLVGEHHMPKLLIVKRKSRHDFWHLARQADTELLYWLEVADMSGRICSAPEQQLLYLDEFQMFAEEYGVWGKLPNIRSPLAPHLAKLPKYVQDYIYAYALYQIEQGRITMAEEALATTYQHREQHSHLVVMCGPSGSGKSSWIANNYPDYALVSLDKLREQINSDRSSQKNAGQIIQTAKELLRVSLRNKQGVVWDATNLRSDFRSIICGLGRDYHALVTLVVFLTAESQLFKNNQQRQHCIPDKILSKQLADYQFPLLDEAHQTVLIAEKGKTLYRSGFYQEDEFF